MFILPLRSPFASSSCCAVTDRRRCDAAPTGLLDGAHAPPTVRRAAHRPAMLRLLAPPPAWRSRCRDLPRPAAGHLPDRPRGADRPGAGRRRRPRLGRGLRARRGIALGLDLPLWQQFLIYLEHVLQGDFGTSVLTSRPVLEDIVRVFPATLELATVATIIGVLLGVPMGVAGAVWQGRWPDHLVRVLGLVGYSVPVFWLGLMGLLLFYAKLGWVEGPGPARRVLRGPGQPGHRRDPDRRRDRRRLGRVLERALATSSCRPRSWATSRSPTSPA